MRGLKLLVLKPAKTPLSCLWYTVHPSSSAALPSLLRGVSLDILLTVMKRDKESKSHDLGKGSVERTRYSRDIPHPVILQLLQDLVL